MWERAERITLPSTPFVLLASYARVHSRVVERLVVITLDGGGRGRWKKRRKTSQRELRDTLHASRRSRRRWIVTGVQRVEVSRAPTFSRPSIHVGCFLIVSKSRRCFSMSEQATSESTKSMIKAHASSPADWPDSRVQPLNTLAEAYMRGAKYPRLKKVLEKSWYRVRLVTRRDVCSDELRGGRASSCSCDSNCTTDSYLHTRKISSAS